MSSRQVTGFAPSRMSLLVPTEASEVMGPGTASTSFPCSRARSTVIRAPERAGASTTSTPKDSPAMIRLRRGNVHCVPPCSKGNSEITAPEAAILLIKDSLPAGYGLPRPVPSTAMVRPEESAPRWAAVSIPGARPETTVTPLAASSRASLSATTLP